MQTPPPIPTPTTPPPVIRGALPFPVFPVAPPVLRRQNAVEDIDEYTDNVRNQAMENLNNPRS